MINLKSIMSNFKYTALLRCRYLRQPLSVLTLLVVLVSCSPHDKDLSHSNNPHPVYDNEQDEKLSSIAADIPENLSLLEYDLAMDDTSYQSGTEGWQSLYASLLRYYAELSFEHLPNALEWDRYFILHDINQDGIPELFIVMQNLSGHTNYYAIYTFSNGEAISLEFDKNIFGHSSILAPLDNSPWIILSHAVGSGVSLTRMKIDGNAIVSDAQGFFDNLMENEQLVPHAITESNIILEDKCGIRIRTVDYIHVTNGSKERKYMREGDSFLGLTLESIGWSNIATMDNEFLNHVSVVATFVGEITAQGDIRTEIRYDQQILHVFTPQEAYLFPWLMNDSGDTVFHIRNFNELNTENIYELNINTLMIVRYYDNVFNYITVSQVKTAGTPSPHPCKLFDMPINCSAIYRRNVGNRNGLWPFCLKV